MLIFLFAMMFFFVRDEINCVLDRLFYGVFMV